MGSAEGWCSGCRGSCDWSDLFEKEMLWVVGIVDAARSVVDHLLKQEYAVDGSWVIFGNACIGVLFQRTISRSWL